MSRPDLAGMDGLVGHLARFAGALRDSGVSVSLNDEADGLTALTLVDLGDRDEVRRALRTTLKIRPRDAARFEEIFGRMWRVGSTAAPDHPALRAPRLDRPPMRPKPVGGAPRPRRSETGVETAVPEGGEEPGYSPEAVLRRKPFEECGAADLLAMEQLLARLALRLATRRSRRRVPVRGRGETDLRRSFRRALAHGGEFLSLARRARPIERPRLVVLCDTSGSMDPHARFLLGFVLALRRVARGSEIFAFNTSLVRLTPWLRPGRVDLVLDRLAASVPDWSGGTRIGECLADFVAKYLDSTVDGKTVVLILSDGLDRGDVAPLAGAMRAIQARARRVYWLNPLAGDARYEPTARAMAAALPYLDRLLPAHNLESLARLLPLLAA
ncbi:MAG TPA: VWA domain-containing protein [Thermoanaerobaculia bacterium]|nr:VWA domain-containing protein [Thermoanaerobaculia bacterium]